MKSPGNSLKGEKPLLLNPYESDFREHISFGTSKDKNQGFAGTRDEMGRASVKVYDLNRDGLPEKRKEEQDNAKTAYSQAVIFDVLSQDPTDVIERVLERYKDGKKPYSAAALDEIVEFARMKNLRVNL